MIHLARGLFRNHILRNIKMWLWYPWLQARQKRAVLDVKEGRATGVLVYQMGKVASKSIAVSLSEHVGLRVFHLHLLDPAYYQEAVRSQRILTGYQDVSHLIEPSRIVFDGLVRIGHKLKIISLVREPIARNISAYFQDLDSWLRVYHAHTRVSLDDLMQKFKESYFHHEPLRWFDEEFYGATGIDIYKTQFRYDLGYERLSTEQFDVLIIRHDLSDELKAKLIGELVGIEGFQLTRNNTAETKPYRDCYRMFLKSIRLEKEYVDKMLDSKYTRHFFSPNERERLRRHWLRLDANDVESANT